MLRDVVVHIQNEQPIMADLLSEPVASDVALICSNVRTTNGTKPDFADLADSTFVIPLSRVRFIEIHKASLDAAATESQALSAEVSEAALRAVAVTKDDHEDEDEFIPGPLSRLTWLTTSVDASDANISSSNNGEMFSDEIDPDLLRRIREA
jgi:hypothetical protein